MSNASRIALGTVQFGLDYGINNKKGQIPEQESIDILKYAQSCGVKYLDSAEAYGSAHEVIRKYHKEQQETFDVCTKLHPGVNISGVQQYCEDLTKELGISTLDTLMYHSFTSLQEDIKTFPSFVQDVSENLVRKWGVSIYENAEFEQALEIEGIKVIQIPFNLLDNYSLKGHLIEQAKSKGIEIHARSCFLQGLFFRETNQLPNHLTPLKMYLDKIQDLARENNLSMTDLALGFNLAHQGIEKVLIGVDSIDQFKSNLEAIESKIPSKLLAEINDIFVKESDLINPSKWQ